MIKLYYHGGSGNHGCEAIVRGTKKILDTDLMLYSMRKEEDIKYGLDEIVSLQEDEVNVIKNNTIKDYLCRIARKISGKTELRTIFERLRFVKSINKKDIYLSIGGDNYCYAGYETLSDLNSIIKKRGGKTVLWGCSVEPSIINEKTEKDFEKYDLIIARESITFDALKKINSNTKLYPDPAFALEPKPIDIPKELLENPVIGINLSPLITKNEKKAGITMKNYEGLIEYILQKTSYNIALVAHVVWNHDNDKEILDKLYEKYGESKRIYKLYEGNAEQLKWCISKCKMFIGARTHATIAAYSSMVPTVVIGYSVKARGIARDLFGTENNYVLPVQNLKNDNEIVEAFKWLEANYMTVKQQLEKIIPEYKESVLKSKTDIQMLEE